MPTPDKLPTMAGPALYRVRIRGPLDPKVAQFLGDLEVDSEHDEKGEPIATLRGVLADQAALAGLLGALYTYHLPILSIECLGATEPTVPHPVDEEPHAADDPSTTKSRLNLRRKPETRMGRKRPSTPRVSNRPTWSWSSS